MGGFFGAISKRDCVLDIFFGVDYHSHLGTRRGGMAIYDAQSGFQRQIHNIENTPFRTKFESGSGGFPRLQRHRLHLRHGSPAAAGAFPSGAVCHHHCGHHQQRRGAGGKVF